MPQSVPFTSARFSVNPFDTNVSLKSHTPSDSPPPASAVPQIQASADGSTLTIYIKYNVMPFFHDLGYPDKKHHDDAVRSLASIEVTDTHDSGIQVTLHGSPTALKSARAIFESALNQAATREAKKLPMDIGIAFDMVVVPREVAALFQLSSSILGSKVGATRIVNIKSVADWLQPRNDQKMLCVSGRPERLVREMTRRLAMTNISTNAIDTSFRRPKLAQFQRKEDIRALMRSVPSAVFLITARTAEQTRGNKNNAYHGMTVSSLTTVAMSPVPYITFNVRTPSRTLAAIEETRYFFIHALADNSTGAALANLFTKSYDDTVEPFRMAQRLPGTTVVYRSTGVVIDGPGVVASMSSRITGPRLKAINVGDHRIVIASVADMKYRAGMKLVEGDGVGGVPGTTLAYAQRGYRRVTDVLVPSEIPEAQPGEALQQEDPEQEVDVGRQGDEVEVQEANAAELRTDGERDEGEGEVTQDADHRVGEHNSQQGEMDYGDPEFDEESLEADISTNEEAELNEEEQEEEATTDPDGEQEASELSQSPNDASLHDEAESTEAGENVRDVDVDVEPQEGSPQSERDQQGQKSAD